MINNENKAFKPGQNILLREIWQGRLWSARPVIVVQDNPDLLVLYSPPGTIFKQPLTLDGKRPTVKTRLDSKWSLVDSRWEGLRLVVPGRRYSVILFPGSSSWYINLEDPLTCTNRGFDYMDMLLDVIVEPNLQDWQWKDEDELQEAIELSLVSRDKAQELYAEGERVVKMLQSGKSIFNGWEHWIPDPTWKVPILPEGWDII